MSQNESNVPVHECQSDSRLKSQSSELVNFNENLSLGMYIYFPSFLSFLKNTTDSAIECLIKASAYFSSRFAMSCVQYCLQVLAAMLHNPALWKPLSKVIIEKSRGEVYATF